MYYIHGNCLFSQNELMEYSSIAMQNALHLQALALRVPPMTRLKDETLCIRTSADIKQLLRLAADRERRSVASLIEILIVNYAKAHGLTPEQSKNKTAE
ncbi:MULTISPECIES: hypothetical protein [unclassified Pantoea]|uniref:hypothetical protein n=1 Tax=unclassified Pantoea TaxID=2630326 RepID=UPI001CC211F1|nr:MULTISPECIES: hypothetical protein [unclassified Pantoea]